MKNAPIFLLVFSIFILTGCKSKHEIKHNKNIPNAYFNAFGKDLSWQLAISEEIIFFETADKKYRINTSHVEPVRAMDSNVKMYVIDFSERDFTIEIIHKDCRENMGEEKDTYSVRITIKGFDTTLNFEGCGKYIADYRLNDVWVLEDLKGKPLSSEHYVELMPFLEIKHQNKTFSGFGGCNRIRGALFQERELLRFTDISSSEILCDPKNKEDFFIKTLQSTTQYEIKNNRLYLSNPDGVKIIFKKID